MRLGMVMIPEFHRETRMMNFTPGFSGFPQGKDKEAYKMNKLITVAIVTSMLSTAALADANEHADNMTDNMPAQSMQGAPMMGGGNGMNMDPAMMQQMMQMRQQRMAQGQGGPMMGGGNGMNMDPAMMQRMMQMRQQRMGQGGSMGGPMSGMGQPGGAHHGTSAGGMMNPQMKQMMMRMRQQHMAELNARLDRIESKLDQLLSRQK